ncbi:MAG: TipAS antibiotic-recognition domain-containing protein, partial [Clostridia bacterium]|nr:TipAS antibiotic-recognition domain-containing protein [Clostridia bacterium]
GSDDAPALFAVLPTHITAIVYPCTGEVLQGLGEMYVGDERFRESIDKRAGDGTAEFVSKAIKAKK